MRSISSATSTAALGIARPASRRAAGCLDDHHAEVVGEHVVELARDAAALGGDRAPLLLLAHVLGPLGLLGQLAGEHVWLRSARPTSHGAITKNTTGKKTSPGSKMTPR